MRAVGNHSGRALVVALAVTARAAVAQQIPPSIEFRVPKTPTIAVSDSGAFIVYELHVTNLTSTPMRLRRVEVLDADKRSMVVSALADSALLRAITRPAPVIPVAQRTEIGAGLRAYVYLWIPVNRATAPTRPRID